MIIKNLKLKIQKNGEGGKWKKGVIVIPGEVSDHFGWKEQDIVCMFASLDEHLNQADLEKAMGTYRKILQLNKEISKLQEVDQIDKFIKVPSRKDDEEKTDEGNEPESK